MSDEVIARARELDRFIRENLGVRTQGLLNLISLAESQASEIERLSTLTAVQAEQLCEIEAFAQSEAMFGSDLVDSIFAILYGRTK